VTPRSMIPEAEPWRNARTGVPHAIASIIAKRRRQGYAVSV
jgi:hypothetical protein